METLLDNKRKNVVKKVKKSVNTRWLSLHAFVDGVHEEYFGLLETFSKLEIEGRSWQKVFLNHEKVRSLLECCIH